jgi:4-methyl-5(b-hydroxyethyl)-thiazole monophosphate biosynthesis
MLPKVLFLLHPGMEEIEAVAPVDILRRAGAEVVTASVTGELPVEGSHGIRIVADALLRDCGKGSYDMLVIPGGPGVDALRQRPEVLDLARRHREENRFVAAICAAPLVLLDAGILGGRTVTSFPGVADELRGRTGVYSEERVMRDGKIITSRGAGTAEEFALELVRALLGDAAAEETRRRIVAR